MLEPTWQILTTDARVGWNLEPADDSRHMVQAGIQASYQFLELLAVWKALRHFQHSLTIQAVLVHSDNVSAVQYLLNQGGTRSVQLNSLAVKILSWAERHLLALTASYMSRHLNVQADCLSRTKLDLGEWSLNTKVFQSLTEILGFPSIDLMATAQNRLCQTYISRWSETQAAGQDTLNIPWEFNLAYIFLPISILAEVARKIRDKASIILIATNWLRKMWYMDLLQLSDIKIHSTRAVSTSWAQKAAASPEEIYKAATWSSVASFAKHYRLDLQASSVHNSPMYPPYVDWDIRKFFGVTPVAKKPVTEKVEKKERAKNGDGTAGHKKSKDKKVKSPVSDDSLKKQQVNKKRRAIYDSDSEEETPPVKKSKKPCEKSPSPVKPLKITKPEPVTYVSDSDPEEKILPVKKSKKPCEKPASPVRSLTIPKPNPVTYVSDSDEDFHQKKKSQKPKENGTLTSGHIEKQRVPSKAQAPAKSVTPEKRITTSLVDYFGTGSVKRSDKKLVASKRKEPCESTDDSTLDDEAIAKQLQLEEDAELERQLHDDEEFARTLEMLDEAPKNKVRKGSGEEKPLPTSKISPGKIAKPTQASKDRTESLSEDFKNNKEKDHIKAEPTKPRSQSESSFVLKGKAPSDKTSPTKTSSKLAMMKQKDEVNKRDKEPSTPVMKEKLISPKKEQSTPAKTHDSGASPEDSEKKRANYQAYRNFLNREGPKALGSKDIPTGADNCMEGLTFVITGVLESIERDEAKSLVERYGGKVTGNVSKKTSYLIMGRDGGESKREKAESFGTKIIDEDGLFNLIRTLPGRRSKYDIAAEAEVKKAKVKTEKSPDKIGQGVKKPSPIKKKSTPEKKAPSPKIESSEKAKMKTIKQEVEEKVPASKTLASSCESLLWVDKYKPTSLKAIIGQQGDQSCANKLMKWLKNWHLNNSSDEKKPAAKYGKFGGKDDGASCKAALLSGPPGVGKTTTAVLVCEELGYSYVELNASDTRSKNSMKDVVAESLNNTSIKGFYSGMSKSVSAKHALIMDEVDGMAGNEDRGGMQELITLIKHSKIPIICMCNDRNHPKIRSLANYCLDLRFQRPRVEQIKGAMMSVAFKEGLKIPPPAMNEIILGANQDIRQVLHNLSMWCARSKALSYDEAKSNAGNAKKDIKMGPFDVVRKVFSSGEETAHMTLIDKSDLFFHDYSLAPLFVQENYVHVKPVAAGGNIKKHLLLLSKAADSICDGDLVDKVIRSKQTWSLLPTQAIYASVLPGELMKGYMSQFPNFPSWLGKYSSTGKHDRITQELTMHMCLRTRTNKGSLNLDYLSYMRNALVQPLCARGADGVQDVVEFMDTYYLMKEDFDNIMEICSWGGKPSAFSKLDPKVKAAFTRGYNKETHLTPYSLQMVKASKREAVSVLDSELNEELNAEESQADEKADDVEMDAMIKAKKAKPAKPSKASKSEKGGEKKPGKAKGKKS
ncbi:replication factor C subunit 1 [Rhinophrynus dorsalis]